MFFSLIKLEQITQIYHHHYHCDYIGSGKNSFIEKNEMNFLIKKDIQLSFDGDKRQNSFAHTDSVVDDDRSIFCGDDDDDTERLFD